MSVRAGLLVAISLAAPGAAWAFPCTVEGGKTLLDCINEVNSGEEVLLPARARIEVKNLIFPRKNVVIRSVSPDWPATLVHAPGTGSAPSSSDPLSYGPMFGVASGRELTLVDVDVELYDADPLVPSVTVSRLANVDGTLNLRNVRLDGVRALDEIQPLPRPEGGFLALVRGTGAKLTLEGVEVTDLDARNLLGGAVVVQQGAEVIVDGPSRFENLTAYEGPAILGRWGGSITVMDTVGSPDGPPTFQGNTSRTLGGAISVHGDAGTGSVQLIAGRFVDNEAADKGGHVAIIEGDLLVDGASFEGGRATHGAGLYVRQGGATVVDSVFRDNAATGDGGAVDVYFGTSAVVSGSRFEDNQAARGGAVYLTTIPGPVTLDNNLFCGDTAATGGALYSEYGAGAVGLFNNLVDGGGASGGPAIDIRSQTTDMVKNTFVRVPGPAVSLQAADGDVVDNVFGWVSGDTALALSQEPEARVGNVYFDADGGWSSEVQVGGAAAPLGEASVSAPLGLTGTRGDGELGARCDLTPHHLRPDSPLLGGLSWADALIQDEVRGVFGGPGPLMFPGHPDPWLADADGDSIVAIWDCDDQDSAVGRLCPGESEDPGDPSDPGDPEEISWYGSCSTIPAGGLAAPGLALVALVGMRRRRRGRK